MLEITSPQNPRIKQLSKLRTRKYRKQSGLFLIDGAREIRRAIESDQQIESILIDFSFPESDDLSEIKRLAADKDLEIWNVTSGVLSKVEFGDRSEGVVAVGKEEVKSLENLPRSPESTVLVLEGIEKPGNLGAILRSADGAGVAGVIVCDPVTDIFNPAVIRASLGTIFSIPIAVSSSQQALDWLKDRQLAIFAAICDGENPYTAADYSKKSAIVMGTEADGLSDIWRDESVTPIQIPMNGIADSLNVSVATAILLYEALRQRSL